MTWKQHIWWFGIFISINSRVFFRFALYCLCHMQLLCAFFLKLPPTNSSDILIIFFDAFYCFYSFERLQWSLCNWIACGCARWTATIVETHVFKAILDSTTNTAYPICGCFSSAVPKWLKSLIHVHILRRLISIGIGIAFLFDIIHTSNLKMGEDSRFLFIRSNFSFYSENRKPIFWQWENTTISSKSNNKQISQWMLDAEPLPKLRNESTDNLLTMSFVKIYFMNFVNNAPLSVTDAITAWPGTWALTIHICHGCRVEYRFVQLAVSCAREQKKKKIT